MANAAERRELEPREEVDYEMERAERDASPNRFPEQIQPVERTVSAASSSSSSSSSSASSVLHQEIGTSASRAATQPDSDRLERNATAMSRIATARSQHSQTVGAGIRSRKTTKPLPEFGGGKPYPPDLPAQEEYVVEFDGVDDPLHAQNWPLKKK